MTRKSVAILTGPDTYLDHLGVLCDISQIPLIVTEEKTYAAARHFYPSLPVVYMHLQDLTLDFLSSHFDTLFESGKFWQTELKSLLQLLYQKNMRFVFCPHGNSDKGFSLKKHAGQDVSLVYGAHMIDLLKETGAFEQIDHLIPTGNYRLPYYRKYQAFYDRLAKEQIGIHLDPHKKTILYAPTWKDGENPTSFFNACETIIEQLSPTYNLLIKLHPFLEEFHPAHTYAIIAKYEHTHKNVLFIREFPAIYPLLALTDIYLGDYSSIGYDFLAFNKPMYFFHGAPSHEKRSLLHPCGIAIPPDKMDALLDFIDTTAEENALSLSSKRKEIYQYAFGKETSLKKIQNIITAIS